MGGSPNAVKIIANKAVQSMYTMGNQNIISKEKHILCNYSLWDTGKQGMGAPVTFSIN